MRFWALVSAISILAISGGYYFRDDLLQYRQVRVGLTQLYRAIDSLFNDISDEEMNQEEDMFEYLVDNSEFIDESSENSTDIDPISCYSWSSLNQLVDDVHKLIFNSYLELNETNYRGKEIQKSITGVESSTELFEMKLDWYDDHIHTALAPTTHNFFRIIRNSLTNIKEFQQSLNNIISKIDADHLRIQRAMIERFARIQRQFEKVIQSQNDAHLECTCDIVKVMNDMTTVYFDDNNKCIDDAMIQLNEVVEATQSAVDNASQFVMRATLPGIEPKESIYDIRGKMTAPVRMKCVFFGFVVIVVVFPILIRDLIVLFTKQNVCVFSVDDGRLSVGYG